MYCTERTVCQPQRWCVIAIVGRLLSLRCDYRMAKNVVESGLDLIDTIFCVTVMRSNDTL